MNMIDQLVIDLALWRGETLEARLAAHFMDMVTTAGFKSWVSLRRDRDPSANTQGWRRIFNRRGEPVLVAIVTWKGQTKPWRFPLESWFDDPLTAKRYYVFGGRLKGIRLDTGIALAVDVYTALPGMAAELHIEKART